MQGIMSGIISSIIFLVILFCLKPCIVISDKIATKYVNIDGNDTHVFVFKIINKSFLFKVYDIKVNAYVCNDVPNVNGINVTFKDIELKGANQWVLNRLNFKHLFQNILRGEKTLQSRCDYACQFFSEENLKSILKNNSYISLQVLAKHSFTGFSKVKIMKYRHPSKIIKGSFLSGNSSQIVHSIEVNETITT